MSKPTTEESFTLPARSYELIDYLDKAFPPVPTRLGRMISVPGNEANKVPGRYITAEEIAHGDIRAAGMRDLIDQLLEMKASEIAGNELIEEPDVKGQTLEFTS